MAKNRELRQLSDDLHEANQKLQASQGEIYKIERMYEKKAK